MFYSIIIPMYNIEDYIAGTLESILENDLTECEIILVDDGSSDKTVEVAEALLSKKSSCYYKIIKKNNTGVSDTRNIGIQVARGKYIIFCDGDDIVEANMVSSIHKRIADNIDMVIWPFYILNGEDKRISQKEEQDDIYLSEQVLEMHLLNGHKVRLGSFAVKRELLISKQVYFTKECTFAEDVEFILKCILGADRIQCISVPLYCYIRRTGSLMNSYNIRRFEAPRAIERVYQYIIDNSIELDKSIKEYIQHGLYVLHYIYSLEGCLVNINSQKEGHVLHNSIRNKYMDVEKMCKEKLAKMRIFPVGVSDSRIKLLKWGTGTYIRVRLMIEKIKEKYVGRSELIDFSWYHRKK